MEKDQSCKINQRKAGVAKIISDKVNFRAKKVIWDNNIIKLQRVDSPRTHSKHKWICTKQQSWKICEAKTDRT